jgi:hypothetical protein
MSMDKNPTAEIEVTPEMIEAGLLELYEYSPETRIAEETVVNIFKKMLMASPVEILPTCRTLP